MRKLTLRIEALKVETFETQAAEARRGTVRGYSADWQCTAALSCDYGCNTRDDGTCPTGITCAISCGETCDASCQASGCGSCGPACQPTSPLVCDPD